MVLLLNIYKITCNFFLNKLQFDDKCYYSLITVILF